MENWANPRSLELDHKTSYPLRFLLPKLYICILPLRDHSLDRITDCSTNWLMPKNYFSCSWDYRDSLPYSSLFFDFSRYPFSSFSRFIFISLLFALILFHFLSLGIHSWIYDETIFGKFPKFMYGHHKCLQIAFYKRIHWTITPVQLFQIGNIDWISINGSLAYFLLHFWKSAHGYVSLLWYTSILLLWWFAEYYYSHSLDNIAEPHLLKIILMIELSFPEKVRYIPVCIELQDSCYPKKCPRIYIPPTYGTFSFLLLNSLGFSIDFYCTYIDSYGEFNLSSDLQWGPVSAPLFLFTLSDPHWCP